MKIIFDANGGDEPKHIIKGAVEASKEFNIDAILVGNKSFICDTLKELSYDKDKLTIINASEKIENNEDPAFAIRKKRDSSILVSLKLLKEGNGDTLISAGSTGALLAGGLFIIGRIPSVKRAVLPTIIPGYKSSTMIIDSGANMDCDSSLLKQFAQMGSVFLEEYYGIKNPKIAILNVGSERGKGNNLVKETYEILEKTDLYFIGNVEARDIPSTEANLVICDGFSGNVLLKGIEGISEFILKTLLYSFKNSEFGENNKVEIAKVFNSVSKKLDANEVGGTILLGLNKPIIKAHGNSNDHAIVNACRYALDVYEKNIINTLKNKLGGN